MSKQVILPLAVALVGVLVIFILVVARPKPTPQPLLDDMAPIKVAVVEGQQQSLRLTVSAQGTVIPKREIDLVAQVSGQVVSVDPVFVSGGFFDASQVLIRIDDREYQAAVLSAKARVADAEQRLAEEQGLSRQALREWRDLGNQNANDLFTRKPQLAAAKANLASAKGALSVAELNLERTRISAPFAGRVRQTQVDLGQYVTVGSLLARVYDSTIVEVRLPLTEAQAALVDLPLAPHTEGSPKELTSVLITGTVAGEQHQWQGVLTRTDAFVDTQSRMYYAVVEVANPFAVESPEGLPRAPLLPGLFVEAEIEGRHMDEVLRLPREALFGRDKLLVIDDENKVSEHRVRVLRRSSEEVWVQAAIGNAALISLEKQSLTPVGTLVEPLLRGASPANSEAVVSAPTDNTSPKE